MTEAKVVKAWTAGCARNLLIALAAFVVLTAALTLLGVLAVLLPVQGEQAANFWFAGFFIILFLFIVVIAILAGWMVRRRARLVDSLFAPLGIPGKAFLLVGRQYHTTFNGRQLDAYFSRGPSLDIYLGAVMNTRMSVGLRGHLSQAVSNGSSAQVLTRRDPDLDHLSIFSLDETWGAGLLDDPQAREIILRLTARQPGFEFRNLLFQPEAIHFQLVHVNHATLSPASLQGWLSDLLQLARVVESLPPPRVTAAASALERKARLSRGDFTLPVVGITFAVLAIFVLIFIIGLLLVFTLEGG